MELTVREIQRRIGAPVKVYRVPVVRCGWCKGFVHEEIVANMRVYVHDERPITHHEVLPYQEQ